MNRFMHSKWKGVCWLCIAAILSQGCTAPVRRDVKNTLTPEEQERVGEIEVIAVNTEPTVSFTGLTDKKSTAVAGAVVGALAVGGGVFLIVYGLWGTASLAAEAALPAGVSCGGLFAILGSMSGASEEDVEWMKIHGRRVINRIKPQKYLPAATARRLGNPTYTVLKNPGQLAIPEKTYAELVKGGKDSVLEVTVEKIGFHGLSDDASVYVTARVRLRLLPEGKVIYETVYYRSRGYKQAATLHKKVMKALDAISDAIVKDVVNLQGATP